MDDELEQVEAQIHQLVKKNEDDIQLFETQLRDFESIHSKIKITFAQFSTEELINHLYQVDQAEENEKQRAKLLSFWEDISKLYTPGKGLSEYSTFLENHLQGASKKLLLQFWHSFRREFACSAAEKEIINWLVNIKFPVFEGMIITPILNEIMSKPNSDVFFGHLDCYLNILINCQLDLEDSPLLFQDELFTSIFNKRIVKNFIEKRLNNNDKSNCEILQSIIKYTSKTIENFNEFIKFIVSRSTSNPRFTKENQERLLHFLFSNIVLYFTQIIETHLTRGLEEEMEHDDSNFSIVTRLLFGLNKQLKSHLYDVHHNRSFTDIITLILSQKKLKDFLNNQKAFTSKYIRENILEALSLVDTKNFDQDDIINNISLVVKDNFKFSISFQKEENLSSFSYENNTIFALREILSVFRHYYNKEVESLNSKKGINRKAIFHFIDIMYKFMVYFNKFFQRIKEFSHLESSLALNFVQDFNKLYENMVHLIIKDLKNICLDKFIALFGLPLIYKFTIENLDEIYNQVRTASRHFIDELTRSKVSLESEEIIIQKLIFALHDKITEELKVSLQQNPKNKGLINLTEKTNKIFDEIITKSMLSQNSKLKLKQSLVGLDLLLKKLMVDNF